MNFYREHKIESVYTPVLAVEKQGKPRYSRKVTTQLGTIGSGRNNWGTFFSVSIVREKEGERERERERRFFMLYKYQLQVLNVVIVVTVRK